MRVVSSVEWTLMRIAIADRAHQCHTMAWFVLQGKEDPQAITCALVGLDTYIANELKHQSKGGLHAVSWLVDGSSDVREGISCWHEIVQGQTPVRVVGDRSLQRTHPSARTKLVQVSTFVRHASKNGTTYHRIDTGISVQRTGYTYACCLHVMCRTISMSLGTRRHRAHRQCPAGTLHVRVDDRGD